MNGIGNRSGLLQVFRGNGGGCSQQQPFQGGRGFAHDVERLREFIRDRAILFEDPGKGHSCARVPDLAERAGRQALYRGVGMRQHADERFNSRTPDGRQSPGSCLLDGGVIVLQCAKEGRDGGSRSQ